MSVHPTPSLQPATAALRAALCPWRVLRRVVAAGLCCGAALAAVAVQAQPASAPAPDAAYVYRVGAGDELSFRFFYTPTLNTVVTVRADGRLTLPMVGEIAVAGLTVAELGAQVEQALAAQVRRPQVTVNVQGAGSQRVFVGGEVSRPGVQPLLGPLTVLQALAVAEGLKETAQPKLALVMRRGAKGERLVLPVNLETALSGEEPAQDLALQPYDVLIVPRSGIANVDRWVDQYIRRLLPFSTGFSYTINRNGFVP